MLNRFGFKYLRQKYSRKASCCRLHQSTATGHGVTIRPVLAPAPSLFLIAHPWGPYYNVAIGQFGSPQGLALEPDVIAAERVATVFFKRAHQERL